MCASESCGGSCASTRIGVGELRRVAGREAPLGPLLERRRAEAEVAVGLVLEPLGEPRRGDLDAPVLLEAPGELLGGLLGVELGEVDVLVGEQLARLQLEQRRDEDEELAAALEVEPLPCRQPVDVREDDVGHVDLAEARAPRAGRVSAAGRTGPRTCRGRGRARARAPA